ncbi:MAG: hypothetical protein AAGI09_11945 [Pseudomonadota bacterium]
MGMVQPVRSAAQPVREISIQGLLHWAFAIEYAQVDFEDAMADAQPASFGMEYVLLQRGELGGMRIDGGGRSASHHDADMVASLVASMPVSHGGRRMALRVGELARAERSEGWMQDARPRCEPREWHTNRYGRYGKSEVFREIEIKTPRGIRRAPVRWCPVVYRDTAREIASARRQYLRWYGALSLLRDSLKTPNLLTSWRVSDAMPAMTPWQER